MKTNKQGMGVVSVILDWVAARSTLRVLHAQMRDADSRCGVSASAIRGFTLKNIRGIGDAKLARSAMNATHELWLAVIQIVIVTMMLGVCAAQTQPLIPSQAVPKSGN